MIYYWSDGPKRSRLRKRQTRGTEIVYREDGSKESEFPYVNGNRHGTEIGYHADDRESWKSATKTAQRSLEKQWDEELS